MTEQKSPETLLDRQQTFIQSPSELGDNPRSLGSNEELVISDIGVSGAHSETRQFESGITIEGRPSLLIQVGVSGEYATVELLDVSGNQNADFRDEETAILHNGLRLGYDNDEPIEATSNYVLVVSDSEGIPKEFHSLAPTDPENPIVIGREKDALGDHSSLPLVVSRRHLAISMDDDGKLHIMNELPKHETLITQPELEPTQIDRVVNLGHPPHDVSLNLSEVAALSNEQQTSDTIGVAGEVVAELLCNSGNIKGQVDKTDRDILLVKRVESDGETVYSLVQQLSDRPGIIQTPIDIGVPVSIVDVDQSGHEFPVSLTVSKEGELAVVARPESIFTLDDVQTKLRYAETATTTYVQRAPIDDDWGEGVRSPTPVPDRPRRGRTRRVVNEETGKVEDFNPHDRSHFEPQMRDMKFHDRNSG